VADHPDTKFFEHGEFLRHQGLNWTSQFGEDGYIEKALERIGIKNQWCFEVGAADGLYLSNTNRLRSWGWRAVLIESNNKHFDFLRSYESDKVHCFHETVGMRTLDAILSCTSAPRDLDLGVIDIDGQDYWVWDDMQTFKPRLLLIEFSPYGSPDDLPGIWKAGQAGINPILALGKTKGYLPLVQTYCNVLFVREDQWSN